MKKLLALMMVLLSTNAMQAQEGFPDPTFGNNGYVVAINTGQNGDFDGNGRLINVKNLGAVIQLTRYNADGTLDASFGTGGTVSHDFSSRYTSIGVGIAVQKGGEIVGVGYSRSSAISNTGFMVIMRFTPNGELDASFGTDGIVEEMYNLSRPFTIEFFGVLSDGKIVIKRSSSSPGGGPFHSWGLRNADGTPLQGGGGTTPQFTGTPDEVRQVHIEAPLIQPDDKIIIGSTYAIIYPGLVHNVFVINRFYPDGTLDGSFGNNGAVQINFGIHGVRQLDYPRIPVAAQPDGKIIMRKTKDGIARTKGVLVRLNANGTPDPDFSIESPFDVFDVIVQADGKIITGGHFTVDGANKHFILARYHPDGSFDPTFGYGGMSVIALPFAPPTVDLQKLSIAGNLLYAYGGGYLAAFQLSVPSQAATATTITQNHAILEKLKEQKLSVLALPNPAPEYFTLHIRGNHQQLVQVRIMDAMGRTVEVKHNIPANSTLSIGHRYRSGIYYAEVMQGKERITTKLLKGRN